MIEFIEKNRKYTYPLIALISIITTSYINYNILLTTTNDDYLKMIAFLSVAGVCAYILTLLTFKYKNK